MKRMRKGTVVKIGAFSVVLAVVFSILGGISFASGEGNEPFLGDYIEYGIICNYLNQTSDMETNFVVGKYQGNGQYTGNTVAENKANAAGMIRAGEVVRLNGKSGNAKDIKVREKDTVVYVDEGVKKEVTAFLGKVQEYSDTVFKNEDMKAPEVSDMNNYVIDVTGSEKKTVYVNADNFAKAVKAGDIQNGALKLRLRENQAVVLNIKEDKAVTLPRYNVEVPDGKKNRVEKAKSIIWNMPNASSLKIASDSMASTIIAPRAFVDLETTGEGWLVCDTITANSGEWHMISRDISKSTSAPETSTKEPAVTEKSTPLPTKKPTMNPTVPPRATAVAAPTDDPTPTPGSSDEINPSSPATDEPTTTPDSSDDDKNPPATDEPTATPGSSDEKDPSSTVTATPKNVTEEPTKSPTKKPTAEPTKSPTKKPTAEPTKSPTKKPTAEPTKSPTKKPTVEPTKGPTTEPTENPIKKSTGNPAEEPTTAPTDQPTVTAGEEPPATEPGVPTVTPENSLPPISSEEPGTTPEVTSEVAPESTPSGDEPVVTATPVPTSSTDDVTTLPDDGDKPTTPKDDTTNIDDNKTPTTSLTDPKVPRAKAMPESKSTTILDSKVPLSDSAPKTGDDTNLLFPLLGMGISALAMIIVLIVRKKKD